MLFMVGGNTMNDRLKRIQSMAQRYNRLGVVSDEAVASR